MGVLIDLDRLDAVAKEGKGGDVVEVSRHYLRAIAAELRRHRKQAA